MILLSLHNQRKQWLQILYCYILKYVGWNISLLKCINHVYFEFINPLDWIRKLFFVIQTVVFRTMRFMLPAECNWGFRQSVNIFYNVHTSFKMFYWIKLIKFINEKSALMKRQSFKRYWRSIVSFINITK